MDGSLLVSVMLWDLTYVAELTDFAIVAAYPLHD